MVTLLPTEPSNESETEPIHVWSLSGAVIRLALIVTLVLGVGYGFFFLQQWYSDSVDMPYDEPQPLITTDNI